MPTFRDDLLVTVYLKLSTILVQTPFLYMFVGPLNVPQLPRVRVHPGRSERTQ
jgi:hypothetical protein